MSHDCNINSSKTHAQQTSTSTEAKLQTKQNPLQQSDRPLGHRHSPQRSHLVTVSIHDLPTHPQYIDLHCTNLCYLSELSKQPPVPAYSLNQRILAELQQSDSSLYLHHQANTDLEIICPEQSASYITSETQSSQLCQQSTVLKTISSSHSQVQVQYKYKYIPQPAISSMALTTTF